jgi:hypothetical protein
VVVVGRAVRGSGGVVCPLVAVVVCGLLVVLMVRAGH